jgi:Ca-activated chloride channel family protein
MLRWSALLLILAAAGARAGTWSNLWFTPEQQGQRALEAGHASEAAQMFTDPRRRAYAELEAKNYEAAQKQLEPLSDAESQYNRGNALARSGSLRPALDAYDASLKHKDADAALRRDAQHNRDLVAKQLENQQQQGGQSGNPQGDKDQKDRAAQDQKGQPQTGQQNQQSDSKESSQSNAGNQGQSPKANQSQGTGSRQNGEQQAPGSQNGEGQEQGSKADAQQAQRDAAQAMQQSRQSAQNQTKTTTGEARKGQAQSEPPQPPTEQTLALDQWLRQIPDDPGGLLRRKFLIEHMIKQEAGGTP